MPTWNSGVHHLVLSSHFLLVANSPVLLHFDCSVQNGFPLWGLSSFHWQNPKCPLQGSSLHWDALDASTWIEVPHHQCSNSNCLQNRRGLTIFFFPLLFLDSSFRWHSFQGFLCPWPQCSSKYLRAANLRDHVKQQHYFFHLWKNGDFPGKHQLGSPNREIANFRWVCLLLRCQNTC